jgi:hypothetical protein
MQDDTDAINKAISDGNRCGEKCYGSSVKNAIVYFPGNSTLKLPLYILRTSSQLLTVGKGTYLVSAPIIALYGTQMIGNPNALPTIKAAPSFLGLGVISTDVYTGGGTGIDGRDQEYYINTVRIPYTMIANEESSSYM